MMYKPQISRCKGKIEQFCKKHHISKLALFGSILTSRFKKSSDVDFLVEFERKHIPGLLAFIGMEIELSEIISHKADLKRLKSLALFFATL
jgi:predicted nucleotidyltransferase